MMLKSQISNVLLTFAKDREIGETYLDRNAPIGTEIAIEQMNPIVRKIRIFYFPKSIKYFV